MLTGNKGSNGKTHLRLQERGAGHGGGRLADEGPTPRR
jgi:hypothetical protein